MIYFVVFFISYFFAVTAKKSFEKNNKKLGIFNSAMAILIPSLLAGFRMKGVGTDTLYYFDAAFMYARRATSFTQLLKISNIEPLYNLVNYIVSRFTDNINYVYFFLQLITMIFIYLACFDNKEKVSFPESYLVFMLLFFNRSLNMCRQTIAIVIILYAMKYVKEKNIFKYIIFIFIASGFHNTALLFLSIYIIAVLIEKKDSFIYKLFIILLFLLIFALYKPLIIFIVNTFNFISNRYLYYVMAKKNIILIELIFKIILLGTILLFYDKLIKYNEDNKLFLFLMIIDFILYLLGFYAGYAQRISYYLGYLIILIIPQFKSLFQKQYQNLILILIIGILSIYSFVYYDIKQYDETVPYKSVLRR